jgi:thiamine biosynthesis protein ThiI
MKKAFVIHYGEIGLKGKNRITFENTLVNNISLTLENLVEEKPIRKHGRIVLFVSKNLEEIKERLACIPGIKYFALSLIAPLDIDKIKDAATLIAKGKKGSFKVSTSRSNKKFYLNSVEINRIVGEHIVNSTKKEVDLENPGFTIFIEICKDESYVYSDKIKGIGGLPVFSSEKIISLLSGGIDSAVASFLMMKRGCKVVFVHFFNYTRSSANVKVKIERLVAQLSKYQVDSKLYMVPFREIQMEIIKNVPSKLRMLVYRRFMMRIASKIADLEGAKAFVTGDSISQVASQTIDNLNVIYSVAERPVFTPLSGMDKEEIIEIAKKIGTYDISILPYEDCCSFMIARHPETRCDINKIEKAESILDIDELVEKTASKAEAIFTKAAW